MPTHFNQMAVPIAPKTKQKTHTPMSSSVTLYCINNNWLKQWWDTRNDTACLSRAAWSYPSSPSRYRCECSSPWQDSGWAGAGIHRGNPPVDSWQYKERDKHACHSLFFGMGFSQYMFLLWQLPHGRRIKTKLGGWVENNMKKAY